MNNLPLFFLISLLLTPFILTNVAHAEKDFYSIHLGSYHDDEKAKAMAEHLKKLGHNAFYRHDTDENNRDAFKVYIEKYESEAEAEKEAGVLKELGLISDYNIEAIKEKSKTNLPDMEPDKLFESGYHFQVGSMREKMNAEKMVERFQKSGYHALYRQETLKDKGVWYRVYIYGYATKSEAEKEAKKLLGSGMISGYTLKRISEKPHSPSIETKSDKKIYFIHVSSFKEEKNATQTIQSLKKKGLKAFVVKEDISGASWFRVYIGEFENEKAAREKGLELKEEGIIDYFKPLEIDKNKFTE